MGFFTRLFGSSNTAPVFDAGAEAAKLLVSLPPCTQFVVVASPRYSGNYRCEVTVAAAGLAQFTQHLAERTSGGSQESMVARAAMPSWLGHAARDGKTSYMPPAFADNVSAYIANFISEGSARVFCPDCRKVVRSIQDETRNLSTAGPYSEWTASWKCPDGHLLYTEDHDVRFIFSRNDE